MNFRNTVRMSNSLDPDQARHFVGPDLDYTVSVCKGHQQMTHVGTSRQRVNESFSCKFMIICNLEQFVNKDMYGHRI